MLFTSSSFGSILARVPRIQHGRESGRGTRDAGRGGFETRNAYCVTRRSHSPSPRRGGGWGVGFLRIPRPASRFIVEFLYGNDPGACAPGSLRRGRGTAVRRSGSYDTG